MQETLSREKYNPEGINKSNWKVDFNISSSPRSFSTLLLNTNISDNKTEGQPLPRKQNKSECSLVRGTKVEVPQSKLDERETYKNPNCGNYNQVAYSKIRWLGAHCRGQTAEGQWSKAEAQLHINVLEIKTAKFAIESFCRVKKTKSVHLQIKKETLQIDNVTALSHLVKMGGTKIAELNKTSKEI